MNDLIDKAAQGVRMYVDTDILVSATDTKPKTHIKTARRRQEFLLEARTMGLGIFVSRSHG